MPAPLNAQALHRPIRPGGAFSNAHDFAIYNPFFFNQPPSADYFMEKFAVYTIQGAELDSSDRYPPPRCHPCTRKSIIERMQLWLNNPWRTKRMLWLVGPAGVGKSAIMQTVAENECQSNILAALFFSAPNGRNDPRKVITSLAYQLAAKFPPYLNYVRAAIMANPKILEKSIVGTVCRVHILIFIDGLDECNGQDEQILLLSLVSYFTTRFPDAPILWVISSRPEAHITRHLARGRLSSCFDKEEVSIDSTEACQDVELFVRTELRNIRASDPVMSLYLDWPSEWLLLKFLAAAQGFFAYAHTAIRFIKEGSPITRFQLVVDLIDNPFPETSSSPQPMAQLDILYRHILSQITPEDLPHASDILFFLLFPPEGEWWGPYEQSLICDWLGMTPYVMHNALRQLHSVLDVPLPHRPDEPIGIYHKSFTDFLLRMPQPLLNLPTSEPDARRVHYLKCLRIMNKIPITQLPTADRIPPEILFWPHQDLDKRAKARGNLAQALCYVYREAVAQSPDLTSHSILHDMKVLADLDDEPPCKVFSNTTTLPRYSLIDLSDPSLTIGQVDHWNSENDPEFAVVPTPDSDIFPLAANSSREENSPPQYMLSEAQGTLPPQSTRRPNVVVHRFHIGGGIGDKVGLGRASVREPWATLKLVTRAPLPGSKERAPRFIGGDMLRGRVDLRLDTPMNVHSIQLFLRGKIQVEVNSTPLSVANDYIFLDKSHFIYSKKAFGDPRGNGQCNMSKNRSYDGSFHGSYSFPFAIPFPTSIEWRNNVQGEDRWIAQARPVFPYDFPPSFREKRAVSTITYEIGLAVKHGTLRSRSKMSTEVTYLPKTISPPASEKRQTSYREGALLPGPSADPDGWEALPAAVIQGIYQSRPVEATCTLYLAQPLSFTRGTTIPCFLFSSSHDHAFLEALTTPHAVDFRLFRTIERSPQGSSKGKETEMTTQPTQVAKAVWWRPPKTDTPLGLTERCLEGEVHLPKSLVSSCRFPLFIIKYSMELLPFNLPTFASSNDISSNQTASIQGLGDKRPDSLVKRIVEITNFHEFGPLPVPFTSRGDNEATVNSSLTGEGSIPLWSARNGNGGFMSGFQPPLICQS
ncbi:hypothetical protein NP233_g6285 [Leucocoprinus birnbaumii]|uniref:NACHT domain-containing protein n=1 Tax=Leucocoprinus birnbaumii TaxID=56174 RepID=A0AAD5VR97_9AGAR|nr:hypothetical protein NP233_g6285 [Leucocoprinus birnbaumii]